MKSVRDMASELDLSPARFYQLMKEGVFPMPIYDLVTKRPFFTDELREMCLAVRKRNCGINGKTVLFYAKRGGARKTSRLEVPNETERQMINAVFDGVRSLGIGDKTERQIMLGLRQLFPSGFVGKPVGQVVREMFLYFRRQDSGDNAGG